MRKIHYKIHYTEDSSQYTLLKTQSTFQPGLVISSEESHRGLENWISALWNEFSPGVPILSKLQHFLAPLYQVGVGRVRAALRGTVELSIHLKQLDINPLKENGEMTNVKTKHYRTDILQAPRQLSLSILGLLRLALRLAIPGSVIAVIIQSVGIVCP